MAQSHESKDHLPGDDQNRISRLLGSLAPGPFEQPNTHRALAEFKRTVESGGQQTMFERIKTNRKVQRILVGVASATLLVGLVAWTPVGALASEFLSLFRVEKFVVVSVAPERAEQLAKLVDQDNFFGKQEMIEGGAEPTQVASLADAAQLAGFQPLQAADKFGNPTNITVNSHYATRFTPDVAALREIFTGVNLDPALVPDNIDGKPFDIAVSASVIQSYRNPETMSAYALVEMPSPTVTVPEGVDIKALGDAMLQLLGMSPQEAARMSSTIDWTTTLVLPIPASMTTNMQEISVRGVSGLMFWDDPDRADHSAMLIWQQDGHLYAINGPGTGDVLAFADGLH